MVLPLIPALVALLAGSATVMVVQHFVKPRLPVYTLTTVGLPWIKQSAVTGEWLTSLTTQIELFNENFMHLDVYAVSFDLYAEREETSSSLSAVTVDSNGGVVDIPRGGSGAATPSSAASESAQSKQRPTAVVPETVVVLQHIGSLQDREQHQVPSKKQAPSSPTQPDSSSSSIPSMQQTDRRQASVAAAAVPAIDSSSPQSRDSSPSLPVWSIAPRSNFTATTELYVSMHYSKMLGSSSLLIRLWRQFWRTSGRSLSITTTGVAHIKATTTRDGSKNDHNEQRNRKQRSTSQSSSTNTKALLQAPLTVSLICHNVVDTWRQTVVGTNCTLHSMVPGWTNLTTASSAVRNHVLQRIVVPHN